MKRLTPRGAKFASLRIAVTIIVAMTAGAVRGAEKTADEIAAELANPANAYASMGVSLQYTSFSGDLPDADDQNGTAIIFQPTLPFPVGDSGKNILFRPALTAFVDQPVFDPSNNMNAGGFDDEKWTFGDITFDTVLAGTSKTGVIFGWGVAGTLPAGSSEVTGDQWRLGPEVFFGLARKWGVVGALINHQWEVGGSNEADFSSTSMNYFYAFPLGKGANIGAGPIISYNHEAQDTDQRWSIPLGIGYSKTRITGSNVNKYKVELQYFIEQPDAFGPQWLVKFSWTPVVKNPFL